MRPTLVMMLTFSFLAVPLAAGAAQLEAVPEPSERAVQPVGMNLLAGFIPPVVVIPAGGSVTWTNNDLFAADHTVTGILGAPPGSGNVPPGGTYTATFRATGVVPYNCSIHPWMNGVVVVT